MESIRIRFRSGRRRQLQVWQIFFERPNKKSEEVRQQEEKENEYLKTIGEQKVELDYFKKSTSRYTATIQSCRLCL